MNMHLVPVGEDSQSPFDTIKNINPETRAEYWSARDLMKVMAYGTWERFQNPLNRAMKSAEVQGVADQFRRSAKSPEGGGRERVDYELTRFAAYLVAMNGDPNKPEVAAAQAYFAIKTHIAETRATVPALPQDYASALRELASTVEAKEIAEKQEREQRQLAEQRARAIEAQAPAVAKAKAHTASNSAIGRQEFAREVQFWGQQQGLTIHQESVFQLLRRKRMLISGQRKDRNHPTSQAVKNGWAEVEKGTAENGYQWSKPVIKAKGQDIAWKWIKDAIDDFGQQLNPSKEIAS
ncbi:MAG: phage antirepressor KilAC domain-containing protein [Corynebacterium sp.]|uniref:phage antirepressor KilAC domain-containing protein n=1 Tax=Corynebacterium sp. TaxID=1720 RepID=UPI0017B5781C|nr:phage antirepressor KilAC domain-containing protein [Corynebacterium sp.]NWO15755.1 phage antirepressor KilAC domain-containing protein [Corynebacterium sp.]